MSRSKFCNKIGIYFSFDKELHQIKIIINTFYILLDRFNLTIMEMMSYEGYDHDGSKNHRKIMFKDFTNTDTKFLGYLAKLFFIFEFCG